MTDETTSTEVEAKADAAEGKKEVSTSIDLPVFYGVKAGMTRIFDEAGNHVSVTVVKLIPNRVAQVKTKETDGYEAYQVAYNVKREKLLNNPTKGHLKKAGITDHLTRFGEVKAGSVSADALGKELSLESFSKDTWIDVTGISKGKGFQGVMKRWNFQGGPAAHGSKFHRAPGSIGMCASPGRVIKGKKLPGHMGAKKKTVQNLQVVELNKEQGYLLVKGSVPGSKSGFLRISKAVKK
ncbi:MAG: large subunit ribosomal protein L3 [Bacteriovoracaceae bacterium]|jgi:large subunit ribosomal protein L3